MKIIKTLLIDNYDSFTYNLFQYVGELGGNPVVFRNDEITVEEIKKMEPTHIILSPGPGTPEVEGDIGVCAAVIREMGSTTPILGVCLGHQTIGHVFGGRIVRAPKVMHGKTSMVRINARPSFDLFRSLPNTIEVMRYHSLIIDRATVPPELEITAEIISGAHTEADDGLIMAVAHKHKPILGIQFHPESIGTPTGKTILENFLSLTAAK